MKNFFLGTVTGMFLIGVLTSVTGATVTELISIWYNKITMSEDIDFRSDQVSGCSLGNAGKYVRNAVETGELYTYVNLTQKAYLDQINVCAESNIDSLNTRNNPVCREEGDLKGRVCLFRLLADRYPGCFHFPSVQPTEQRMFGALLGSESVCSTPFSKSETGVWKKTQDSYASILCIGDLAQATVRSIEWSDIAFEVQPRKCSRDELLRYGFPKHLVRQND